MIRNIDPAVPGNNDGLLPGGSGGKLLRVALFVTTSDLSRALLSYLMKSQIREFVCIRLPANRPELRAAFDNVNGEAGSGCQHFPAKIAMIGLGDIN